MFGRGNSVTDTEKAAFVSKKSRRDISYFLENVLNVEPQEWQLDVMRNLREGDDIAVRSGHGVGKTAVATWSLTWWMLTKPFSVVVVTGPTETQLKDILWPELKKWHERFLLPRWFRWTKSSYFNEKHQEQWRALYRTSSSDPENMAGFHAADLLYIVDEASGVSDDVFEVIEGALSEGGQKMLLGNPTRSLGEFYRAFHEDANLFSTYHVNGEECGRVSDRWVEKQKKKWGKKSDIYRVRVQGEFPRGTEDSYIPLYLVSDAMIRDLEPQGRLHLGIDPARYGDDKTSIAVRQGPVILDIHTHFKKDTQETAGIAIRMAKNYMDQQGLNEVDITVDETGIGSGVLDRINEEAEKMTGKKYTMNAAGVKFNENPTDENRDDFNSAIDEMFDNFLRRAESGYLSLPAEEDVKDKLTSHIAGRKFSITPSGKLKMEPKDKFKERVGESPDEGDSVLLSLYDAPNKDDGHGGLAALMTS